MSILYSLYTFGLCLALHIDLNIDLKRHIILLLLAIQLYNYHFQGKNPDVNVSQLNIVLYCQISLINLSVSQVQFNLQVITTFMFNQINKQYSGPSIIRPPYLWTDFGHIRGVSLQRGVHFTLEIRSKCNSFWPYQRVRLLQQGAL